LADNSTIRNNYSGRNKGFILALVFVVVFMMAALGMGLLTIAHGARVRSAILKKETVAKLVTETGYESAIYWMSQQDDVLNILVPVPSSRGKGKGKGKGGKDNKTKIIAQTVTRTEEFSDSSFAVYVPSPSSEPYCSFTYTINFDSFMGTQAVYRIISKGYCGQIGRAIDALVIQAPEGWDMNHCARPIGVFRTAPVFFTTGDTIDMPIHINSQGDPEDKTTDLPVLGKPSFVQRVSMGESRYRNWGINKDKYENLIDLFTGGICFDQPSTRIANRNSIEEKARRFLSQVQDEFNFSGMTGKTPKVTSNAIPDDPPGSRQSAVQLEFFVDKNKGKVRVTNDCIVRCLPGGQFDFMLDLGDTVKIYKPYYIYGYHYAQGQGKNHDIKKTYVKQEIYNVKGAPAQIDSKNQGGLIFVDGNVIIGGAVNIGANGNIFLAGTTNQAKLKGRLMVVATGNIWIVSPIIYDGPQIVSEEGFIIPSEKNTNILGLFSQSGVVRIVDPGLSSSGVLSAAGPEDDYGKIKYKPVAIQANKGWQRILPLNMVVQSIIYVGGGGWGVENVGNRLNNSVEGKDNLIVVGAITEAVRGVTAVGLNGFKKFYFYDQRLKNGILPGNMGFQSKYVVAPGGWSEPDISEVE
jgi:hypothetical protein